jgi:hypothetical protein
MLEEYRLGYLGGVVLVFWYRPRLKEMDRVGWLRRGKWESGKNAFS